MTQTTDPDAGASILVLGGAGAMGRVAVEAIQGFDLVRKVVVADLNVQQAERIADRLGDKVQALAVDAMDSKALVSTMRDFDYVISTLGPFFKFGTRILNAAIEAKVDYVDICDDWEPTLEMLSLDEKARAAGIRALVGAGASPGISNMLAMKAVRALDRVDTLYTGWGARGRKDRDRKDAADGSAGSGSTEGPAAAIEHWVQQFSGSIRVRQGGENCDQAPLQKHVLSHPTGRHCNVYSLGHPEPVTFPLYFPGIKNSYNVMDMSDFVISILRSLRSRVDRGELSITDAASYLEGFVGAKPDMQPVDLCRYFFHSVGEVLRRKKYMPDLYGMALGQLGQRDQTACVWMNGRIPGGMGPMTCVPTAVFLSMLIEGHITKLGVYAPEAAADPEVFFSKLHAFVRKDDPNFPLILSAVRVSRDAVVQEPNQCEGR